MTTKVKTRLNGDAVDQLAETINHIEKDPELARFKFSKESRRTS